MKIVCRIPLKASAEEFGQRYRNCLQELADAQYEQAWSAQDENGDIVIAVPDGVNEWAEMEGGTVQ